MFRFTVAITLLVQWSGLAQPGPSHLLIGQQSAAKGLWKQAEEESRLHLQEFANDDAAAVLHANALVHLHQPYDAALELEDFLKSSPDAIEPMKLYAALLVDVINDRSKAEEILTRASRLAPTDPAVWEGLGRLSLGRHKAAEAIPLFREAVRLAPGDPVNIAGLARSLQEADHPKEAEAEYNKALRLSDSESSPNAIVYKLFGDFLCATDRPAQSIRYYTRAVTINPDYSDAYQGRALAHEQLNQLANAEQDAVAALKQSPTRRDSHQLLLRIYRAGKDEQKLKQEVQAFEKLAGDEQKASSQRREMRDALKKGETLLGQGKFGDAIAAYERVVTLMPDFYEAYFALGICYQQTGDVSKGEVALKKYLSFQPVSADGHAALGLLLMAAHRDSEARPELQRAIDLNPDMLEPRKALAASWIATRDYKKAAALIEPALRQETSDPATWALGAKALFSAGQKQLAMDICDAGLRAYPRDAGLEEVQSWFLLDCGKKDACKLKALQNLKAEPDSPAYLKLVTELLVDNSPLDGATKEMVNRMRQALPDDQGARYVLAKWAYTTNQYEVAHDEATRLSELPGVQIAVKARAFALLGLTLEKMGQTTDAERAYLAGVAANDQLLHPDPQIVLVYVDFLLAQTRDEDALKFLDDVIQWAPRNAQARLRKATLLERSGRREDSVREAAIALGDADEDPGTMRAAHALLAKTYTALGRTSDAKLHQDWIISHP